MPFDLSDKIDIRELKHLRNEDPYRVIIGQININSIRNKFELLVKYVGNDLDILMVSETKIDDNFLESQFLIEGFSTPYRLDRTAKSGGILLYIRQGITSKDIKKITVKNHLRDFL